MSDDIKDKFKKIMNEDYDPDAPKQHTSGIEILTAKLNIIHAVLNAKSAILIIPNRTIASVHFEDIPNMKQGIQRATEDLKTIEKNVKPNG